MSASQFQDNLKANRISGEIWKKISHLKRSLFQNISLKRSKIYPAFFSNFGNSCPEVICKSVLKNFARPATLLKSRLCDKCFPVSFAKCLITPFLQNTSGGCSSFHITINSSLSSILFDFFRHFDIRKYFKYFSDSFFFLLCNIFIFDVYFLKNVFISRKWVWN